jgi:hypothetical protein
MARVAEFGTDAQVQQVFRTGIKGDSSACAYAAKRQVASPSYKELAFFLIFL